MSKYGHRTDNWKEAILNKMGGEEIADAFLAGKYKLVQVAMLFLRHISSFLIPARITPYNPTEFFQMRDGLYVWDAFKRLIITAANSTATLAKEKSVEYYDLTKPATDAQIATDLDNRHVFTDVAAFTSYLASLIEAQWGGKSGGPLLTNGYANIFYVRIGCEGFAVHADWDAGVREWGVGASPLGGYDWGAGDRVFSRNEPSDA